MAACMSSPFCINLVNWAVFTIFLVELMMTFNGFLDLRLINVLKISLERAMHCFHRFFPPFFVMIAKSLLKMGILICKVPSNAFFSTKTQIKKMSFGFWILYTNNSDFVDIKLE